MEKDCYNRQLNFICHNSILNESQFEFHSNKSTATALAYVLKNLLNAIQNYRHTAMSIT